MKKIIAWVTAPFLMIISKVADAIDIERPEDVSIYWISGLFFGSLQMLYWVLPIYIVSHYLVFK